MSGKMLRRACQQEGKAKQEIWPTVTSLTMAESKPETFCGQIFSSFRIWGRKDPAQQVKRRLGSDEGPLHKHKFGRELESKGFCSHPHLE